MRTDLVCGESTLDGDQEDDDGANQVRKLMQVFPFFSHRGLNTCIFFTRIMQVYHTTKHPLPFQPTPIPFLSQFTCLKHISLLMTSHKLSFSLIH